MRAETRAESNFRLSAHLVRFQVSSVQVSVAEVSSLDCRHKVIGSAVFSIPRLNAVKSESTLAAKAPTEEGPSSAESISEIPNSPRTNLSPAHNAGTTVRSVMTSLEWLGLSAFYVDGKTR